MYGSEITETRRVITCIEARTDLLAMLNALSALDLPDAWLAAGALRSAVWDALHGFATPTPLADLDVVYFDRGDLDPAREAEITAALSARLPGPLWQVRNQARMHLRNGDRPYRDSADALAHWLETPTAVGMRLGAQGLELLAPLRFEDLLAMRTRPTPHARSRPDRLQAYRARMRAKNWPGLWPLVTVEGLDAET